MTIDGSSTVNHDVYGGGQRGVTLGGVDVNIIGGTVNHDVYGGGALANTNSSHWHEGQRTDYVELDELYEGIPLKGYYSKSDDTYTLITEGTADGDPDTKYYAIFKTNVNLHGGTINGNVYGGGLGQLGTAITGVKFTQEQADEYNDEKGYVEGDEGFVTTADWKIYPVAASDGEGAIKAMVYGDVLVSLNGGEASGESYDNDCVITEGSVYGCNNVNGTPRGNVTVHVYATKGVQDKNPARNGTFYDLEAVYGGGRNAAYEPADAKDGSGNYIAYQIDDSGGSTVYKPCVYNEDGTCTLTEDDALSSICKTNVIIDGCDATSIKWVYGGGDAAPTPATKVTVNQCYEIGTVFGGGNGAGVNNPGANVGYRNYSGLPGDNENSDDKIIRKYNYSYGTGKAETCLYGGTIHKAFGGSNTKGNVREVAFSAIDSKNECPLEVGEIYGAGNKAFMDAKIEIELGCIDHLETLYGGAMEADVNENIELNVTSGRFGKVFGGNNKGGQIYGTITVNIKETGCHPIVIGELYGGGREADYKAPAPTVAHPYSPLINIVSATSIGKVYGGGLDASVEGNPTILINMEPGVLFSDDDVEGDESTLENNDPQDLGSIGTVFGGGYNGDIIGNTRIEVGTDPTKKAVITNSVFGGGENADVIGKTDVIIGPPIGAIENPGSSSGSGGDEP